MRCGGHFPDHRFCLCVANLVVELNEKSVAPRLPGRTCFDATNVDLMASQRRKGLEQCAGNVVGSEQHHRARGSPDRE